MMPTLPHRARRRLRDSAWLSLLGLSVLSGCGSLLPKPPPPPASFVLGDPTLAAAPTPATPPHSQPGATLVVNEARAAPGYGSRQIVYVRTANRLEYFAFSQWVEPPAVMLAPLLVQAIARTGAYGAVVQAPTSVGGDVRLDTELVRLQQDFSTVPSRVRLTLRAVLIDTAARRVVASREFDADVPAASEDPAGGVAAASQAAHVVLAEVGRFCAEWSPQRK